MENLSGERAREARSALPPVLDWLLRVPQLPVWSERELERLLERAGVRLDGPEPWDPQIRDRRTFEAILRKGTLGAGEAYMAGWWDCERIDELFARLIRRAGVTEASFAPLSNAALEVPARLLNLQGRLRARRAIATHYEIGNDLFEAMLDARMIYSCAWWEGAETLDEAQEAKLERICRKLQLARGERLLDVGCGWGGLAQYAAERHGVEVVGITLSPAQAEMAKRRCAGLPVEIRVQDYRSVRGRFDKIVSVGMLEHVGPRNYRTFFRVLHRCLADDGLALVHTIGNNLSRLRTDRWLSTYIFPDAVLPSARQLSTAWEGLFVMEDWQNFGVHYDRTLLAWHANVERAWPGLPRYDETFRRMWRYYLLSCAGTFRARMNQLWQIVLSKRGVEGGYRAIR